MLEQFACLNRGLPTAPFFLVQGALVSFFVSDIGPPEPQHTNGLVSAGVEALMLAIVGLVFAVLWALVCIGRLRFIKERRDAVVHLNGAIDRHQVYVRVEERADRDPLNPVAIALLVPGILIAVRVGLLVFSIGLLM